MLWLQLVFWHILDEKGEFRWLIMTKEVGQMEKDKEPHEAIGVSLLCGSI